MKIVNKEILIPIENIAKVQKLEKYYYSTISRNFPNYIPIRFIVVEILNNKKCRCEIDFLVLEGKEKINNYILKILDNFKSIFNFNKRSFENTEKFIAALIIPTGIGAELGGHCGDGNAVARLIASACDLLITHPNVVNASDINEMTENTLYVEGSILTRFFMGSIGLQKVYSNNILMLMDKTKDGIFNDEIVNSVSAARVTLGINCDVLEMNDVMKNQLVFTKSGRAAGEVIFLERLFNIIKKYHNDYDAIGLATTIDVPNDVDIKYFKTNKEIVNPYGGMEAMITHSVSEIFKIPCAHSPLNNLINEMHINLNLGIVDPRKAAETSSITYLHCILKGLYKSPRIVNYENGINVENISCLIIPDGCIGLPVLACVEHGIPVIAVKNKNKMENDLRLLPFKKGKLIFANNYLEAIGIMNALKAGISIDSVNRPINFTKILEN